MCLFDWTQSTSTQLSKPGLRIWAPLCFIPFPGSPLSQTHWVHPPFYLLNISPVHLLPHLHPRYNHPSQAAMLSLSRMTRMFPILSLPPDLLLAYCSSSRTQIWPCLSFHLLFTTSGLRTQYHWTLSHLQTSQMPASDSVTPNSYSSSSEATTSDTIILHYDSRPFTPPPSPDSFALPHYFSLPFLSWSHGPTLATACFQMPTYTMSLTHFLSIPYLLGKTQP